MFWRKKSEEAEQARLYAKQLEELYQSLLEENKLLKKELEEVRRKVLEIVERYAPLKYSSKLTVLEALNVIEYKLKRLVTETNRLEEKLRELESDEAQKPKLPVAQEAPRIGLGLENLRKISREQALRKWERLTRLEKEVFYKILVEYFTENHFPRQKDFIKAKSRLIEKGFIRVLEVRKISGKISFYEVYFPSPLGVKVCECIDFGEGVSPWTFLQYSYAKKRGYTLDHSQLVEKTVEKLRHANYELSLDELSLVVRGHKADILVVKPRETYIECETLSNTLEQLFRMLDAYTESQKEYCIVVASQQAKYMYLQRICFYAWETGKTIKASLATLKELPNTTTYYIFR